MYRPHQTVYGLAKAALEHMTMNMAAELASDRIRVACVRPGPVLPDFHLAAEGQLAPFILVVEGSIPNEKIKSEGYWAAFGTDRATGQPITTCDWMVLCIRCLRAGISA